jgi:hypothetical protein
MAPQEALQLSAPASPSASQMLMRAERHPRDSHLWVESKQDVWTLVKVVRQQTTLLTVQNIGTSEKLEIDLVSDHDAL